MSIKQSWPVWLAISTVLSVLALPSIAAGNATPDRSVNVEKMLLGQYGPYTVFRVNGQKVRNLSLEAEEFGKSETYKGMPELVPDKEIWIEDAISSCEQCFVIAGALRELKADSYEEGLKHEAELRRNAQQTMVGAEARTPYVRRYRDLNGIAVWLVDGRVVRDRYKTDYTQGGHGYVYSWIPKNEIWLENGLHAGELPYILLHESFERQLIKDKGMEYDNAHVLASKAEFEARQARRFDAGEAVQSRPLMARPGCCWAARRPASTCLPRLQCRQQSRVHL